MVSDSYSIAITANTLKLRKKKERDGYKQTNGERKRREEEERGRGERKRREREGRREKISHLLHFLHDGGKGLKKGRKVKEAVIR